MSAVTSKAVASRTDPLKPPSAWAGWVFSAIWLVYLGGPLRDVFDGRTPAAEIAAVLAVVVLFSCLYIRLFMIAGFGPFNAPDVRMDPRKARLLAGMAVIAAVLPVLSESSWVVLWIYVSSSAGFALPIGVGKGPRPGFQVGMLAAAALAVEGWLLGVPTSQWAGALAPTMVSCVATMGVRRMQQLIGDLRAARAEVARLAVTEERLRMARDLHDLAGHSLATITLKAELARKLLPVDPGKAEQQILDLEHVSRQSLADIREAVSGYRRATLAVETGPARTALAAAGIVFEPDPSLTRRSGELDPEVEAVLAWCLREAVTNVVRHSGARGCRARLIDARVDGEPSLTLEVVDDGRAVPDGPAPEAGNGLTGLRERLRAVHPEAELTAVPVRPNGFRVTATVPGESSRVAA